MNEDLLKSLKGMLGDNADEKINSVMNMLKSSENSEQKNTEPIISENNSSVNSDAFSGNGLVTPEGLEYISRIKGIIDEMGHSNDKRSNLLLSLKPYMRSNRAKSIDNAVRILNLSKFSQLFKM